MLGYTIAPASSGRSCCRPYKSAGSSTSVVRVPPRHYTRHCPTGAPWLATRFPGPGGFLAAGWIRASMRAGAGASGRRGRGGWAVFCNHERHLQARPEAGRARAKRTAARARVRRGMRSCGRRRTVPAQEPHLGDRLPGRGRPARAAVPGGRRAMAREARYGSEKGSGRVPELAKTPGPEKAGWRAGGQPELPGEVWDATARYFDSSAGPDSLWRVRMWTSSIRHSPFSLCSRIS
jgi:hypothetical protein